MTPELQSQLDSLQRQIDAIRNANDPDYLANNIRFTRAIVDTTSSDDVEDINQSVGATQAFSAPDAFDARLTIKAGDTEYYLGVYNT